MTTVVAEGLVVEGLSKTYSGQRALDHVDLEVKPGEIHALLGHNGSGKSTLIKVLAGYHQPDPGGRAWLDGHELNLGSRTAARNQGLRFVHQDLGVISDMSVLDNLVLGGSYERRWWLDDRFEASAARGLLSELGLDIDPRTPLANLAPAERTMVAIARAVRGKLDGGGALLLDEPTATLSDRGTSRLFELVRRIRDLGTPIVYVTHRLGEVLELADRVTVLRNGRRVATEAVAGIDHDRLVELIVGAPPSEVYPSPPPVGREVMLQVRGVSGGVVRNLTFDLHHGEILGITGLEGSGRDQVCELLFGGRRWDQGAITIEGKTFPSIDPAQAIAAGMAYLPADRATHGSIPSLTLRENLTLPQLRSSFGRWMSLRSEREDARSWLERMGIRPADPEREFSSLSGGNQQRVLLARWLRCEARVLLFDEPTQGVDVEAKTQIYQTLAEAGRGGAAIVMASSDVEELAAVCDRVLVMRDGGVVDSLHGVGLTADALSHVSIGQSGATR